MGEFTRYSSSAPPPGLGGKGLFGASPPPRAGFTGQLLVVGSDTADPATAAQAFASIRDTGGVWHPVNMSALGARGAFGAFVNPDATEWLISSTVNGANALVGVLGFNSTALTSAIDTGIAAGNNLTAITSNPSPAITLFGSVANKVLSTPDLAAFTANNANGPTGYTLTGLTRDGPPASIYVGVGRGSSTTTPGIVTSLDGTTWANNVASFRTLADTLVSSNTVIWDGGVPTGGVGFVAVGGSLLATSPDGLTWTVQTMALTTTGATCIVFDNDNLNYVMGTQDGHVFVAGLPSDYVAGTSTAVKLGARPIRCGIADGFNGINVVGDDQGHVWTSPDQFNWTLEDPGLGAIVLTGAANTQGI